MDSLKQLSKDDKNNILLLIQNYSITNNINNNLELVDFDKLVDKYSIVDNIQIEINNKINNLNSKIKILNNIDNQWNRASKLFKIKCTKNNIFDEDEYNKRFYNKINPSFSSRTGKEQKEYIDNKFKEYNDKLEQYKNVN